ncbi:PREDICTED: neural-cadherin-like [Nicrophorus vespilloides]|uniref:Neural-cadherin-like n=1 Tax=Nicrophorus vespilloides TaxID=110193 RepID=A0ABM1MZB5_NICVS|nr:PREDICTED: neural-cadherin-like [Nicrophorus vespilloides]
MSPDNKDCMDKDECLDLPCLNGGTCINQEPRLRYRCICPDGFWGENCELIQEGQTLKLSMGALAAILVCLLIILILVLVFVVYNRRREAHIKYPGPDDDVRENIINYDDEGGGEDDMTAFDITPLQIPIGGPLPELAPPKMSFNIMAMAPGQEPNVGIFIDEHKKRADSDPNAPPFDDLRNYAYEGGGSTAGSLSSLASGSSDEEQQEYDYLGAWGPRFDKLADMYGPGEETEQEE